MKRISSLAMLAGAVGLTCARIFAQAPAAPIVLHVDLRDAPRKLLHARLQIPVKPGPVTLEYPEWIQGDHRPTGPIDNLTGIVVRAGGQAVPWRRDDVDMYGLHVDVPAGISMLDVSFDFLTTPSSTDSDMGNSTSANMAMIEWNALVLYPAHVPVAEIPIQASLSFPPGWKFGTALTAASQKNDEVSFATVPVYQLLDSPVMTGRYFKEFALAPEITPKHFLDIAAEGPEDLELKPQFLAAASQLVREATALYASHHYDSYHFLLTLSDVLRGEGLEHHQSSDNGIEKEGLSDEKMALLNSDLLSHEFTHSWNGKYRRPMGLATSDPAVPLKGELLWVYEGMTEYWGNVLSARAALVTPEIYRQRLAYDASRLNVNPGRIWRNVQDTAIAAQILRGGSAAWANWRRGQDYYDEGELIWLDADTTIRQLTHDQKSLNDFCVKFLAVGGNTPPRVVPYTFDDIVADLNAVVAYDWRGFLTERLNAHNAHAPLGGIEHGGYKITYGPEPTEFEKALLDHYKRVDAWYSAGVTVSETGMITDVRYDSLAFAAGLGPDFKLVAVNGRAFTGDVFKRAIRAAKGGSEPIELIVSHDDQFMTVKLNCHDGEMYPRLERVEGTPALLDEIIKPMVTAKGSGF